MKAVYLECMAGISGNMLLGAFLQLGVPQEHLVQALQKLNIPEPYEIRAENVSKNGIQAVHLEVLLPQDAHEMHGHGHGAHHGEHGPHSHAHRTMKAIREMILSSDLSEKVKSTALSIFERIAAAEGKVHGCPPDEVHFHEMGAVDSIVDIVGTAICLEYLEVDKVFVSSVNTGSGYVHCAHGLMMVPAPATAELLKGYPTYQAGAEKELATPTGAAVVAALAEHRNGLPTEMEVQRIAYGAGSWELEIPNVLRIYYGEYRETSGKRRFLLETNIDDMNPQIYGYLYDRLLRAGALDVWTTPVYMKKNRPAQMLSVLVEAECRETCAEIVLAETTSIGLRIIPIEARIEAQRRMERVKTRFGEVHCKVSSYRGRMVSVTPEYEDCRRLAEQGQIPLKTVQQEALCKFFDGSIDS